MKIVGLVAALLIAAPAHAQLGVGPGRAGGPAGPPIFPSPPAPPVAAGTGAISGVVIDGPTGRPLPDVLVVARFEGRADTTTLAPRPIGQQITDAKGRFVFSDLGAADGYAISARRPGYFSGAFGGPRGSASGTRVVLAEGEWFSKADISLWPTAAITGRVLDDHGDPVVGTYVRVLREIFIGGSPHLAPSAPVFTDDRGVYRISGLDPGRYLVCAPSVQASVPVSAGLTNEPAIDADAEHRLVAGRYPMPSSQGPVMVYPAACYPERSAVAQATPIQVDFGADRSGVDLRFVPVPASRIAGRVEGAPAAIAGLTLRLLATGGEELGQGSEVATTLVSADGTFTFLGVPSGSYVIDARSTNAEFSYSRDTAARGEAALPAPPRGPNTGSSMSGMSLSWPPRSNITTRGASTRDLVWANMPVSVDGRDITGLTVTLRSAVTMTGRIVFDGAAAIPTNPPFIFTERADGNPSGYRLRTFQSPNDPRDQFVIDGITPGEYYVRGSLGDTWLIRSALVNGREYARVPFTISGNEMATEVTLTFTDKVATLTGSVHDALGVAAPAGIVVLFPADRRDWRNFGMTPDRIKLARATSVGGFRFYGVPAGDYLIVAVDESQASNWQTPAFFEAASRVATRVTVNWGDSKSVNLVSVSLR